MVVGNIFLLDRVGKEEFEVLNIREKEKREE